jgi:hypothetical protein
MQIELIDRFKFLPDVLIHNIINYTDVVVYRHGKYINRLNKNDIRYKLTENILLYFYQVIYNPNLPIRIGKSRILLRLLYRNREEYFLEYIFRNNSYIYIYN